MYEQLELQRIALQQEQQQIEKSLREKDFKFRCLDIARNFASDTQSLLKDAEKIWAFVNK